MGVQHLASPARTRVRVAADGISREFSTQLASRKNDPACDHLNRSPSVMRSYGGHSTGWIYPNLHRRSVHPNAERRDCDALRLPVVAIRSDCVAYLLQPPSGVLGGFRDDASVFESPDILVYGD